MDLSLGLGDFFGGLFSSNELVFSALGPRGSGKTTLLACMNKEFERVMPGAFFPSDRGTFKKLNDAYRFLEAEASSPTVKFDINDTISATENLSRTAFTIKGHKKSVNVSFFDFPGAWLNGDDDNGYNQVVKIVKSSSVVMITINSPAIMFSNGKFKSRAAIDEIEQIIRESLQDDPTDKLFLFIPIKCERYTRSESDTKKLTDKIKELFSSTLNLDNNPLYHGHLAMALLPIHTAGNVQFSCFKAKRGTEELTGEVYLKDINQKFCPRDADQPLRYAMSFLLNQSEKQASGGIWGYITSLFSGDMKEVAEMIRKGIKKRGNGFEIFCGRDLLGF